MNIHSLFFGNKNTLSVYCELPIMLIPIVLTREYLIPIVLTREDIIIVPIL